MWRPKKVKVLLIAESHVRELKGDLRVRVKSPRGAPKGLPSQYVRLIFCLGYGDNSLCEPELKSNRGTPQFWQLFQIIADCSVDAKAPREIAQKLKTLRKLQDRGVWLVDASIGALTQPGKTRKERRIKIKKRRTTIKESFETFVWPMVKRDPSISGAGVGDRLRSWRGAKNL
jgi:hypothetical protein